MITFTEFCNSVEFSRDKFFACSTKRGMKDLIINKIIELSKAQLIQVIGGVMVIYRPFEDNPDIILPRS